MNSTSLPRPLAIVLKSVPYQDRHLIVTALTDQMGKISVMANNAVASRRFGGTLDLFTAAEWRLSPNKKGNLYILEETLIRKAFPSLSKDFQILSLASVMNEILLKIAPEEEACEDLFKLYSNSLLLLEEQAHLSADKIIAPTLNCFLSKILQWNGTQPQLQKCLGCERSLLDFTPDTVFRCHISIACWTCPGCRSVKPDSSEHYTQGFDYRFFEATQAAIGDFYLGLTHPIRQILDVTHSAPKDQKLLFNLLISLLQYHVPGFDKKSLSALPFLGLS